MQPTLFFPIFLLMTVVALTSVQRWAWMMGFSAFFQAASPIAIVGGGRYVGIAPVYCLMFIGLWHVYGSYYNGYRVANAGIKDAPRSLSPLWLTLFVLIGVTGAIFLPRLLQGMVLVLPPRGGLDSGFTVPLVPTSGNYIQSFYLLCILGLFMMVRHLTLRKVVSAECFIRGIVAGLVLAVAVGYYQFIAFYLGLPWPGEIINSNAGLGQLPDQTAFGVKRISSLFMEPSTMSQHLLGGIGVLVFGLQRKLLGLFLLGVILLSTSSLAYFGLLGLSAVWLLTSRYTQNGGKLSLTLVLVAIVGAGVSIDFALMSGQITQSMLFEKMDSGSGQARLNADALAVTSFIQSFGLGSGVGSARASSLPASLAATVGLPGLLLFAAFLWSSIASVYRQRSDQERAIFFGMVGLLIAWLLAAPDINIAFFWILAGLASGSADLSPQQLPPATLRSKAERSPI
ncbi:MAG: hypothetical protein RIS44_2299 [Pseudomonadota bacterium]|jgi:hypothetical protein